MQEKEGKEGWKQEQVKDRVRRIMQSRPYSRSFVWGEKMKINEKRVACPPKAAKLEIHFEGNLICCKWAKNILLCSALRSCTVCPSASSECWHVFVADEDAMLWIAQLRGGKHRSLLITPVTAFSFYMTALQHSLHVWIQLRLWRRTCQKLLVKNKVWPIHLRCLPTVFCFVCFVHTFCVSTHIYMCM